jgi:hypothetical protein
MARQRRELPGMEPERCPELESLAEAYVRLRDERMGIEKKERAKRDLLSAKMKEKALTTYEFDGRVIEFETSESVKVRKADKEE